MDEEVWILKDDQPWSSRHRFPPSPSEFVSVAQQLSSQRNLQPIGLLSNLIMGLRQFSAVVPVCNRWTGEPAGQGAHSLSLPSTSRSARSNRCLPTFKTEPWLHKCVIDQFCLWGCHSHRDVQAHRVTISHCRFQSPTVEFTTDILCWRNRQPQRYQAASVLWQ